jgi:hypothetical protein
MVFPKVDQQVAFAIPIQTAINAVVNYCPIFGTRRIIIWEEGVMGMTNRLD